MRAPVPSLLLFIFICSTLAAPDLTIKNSCSFGVWAQGIKAGNAMIDGETQPIKYIAPGGSTSYNIPNLGLTSTRFWVKYGCNSNGANCAIGDQIPNSQIYPTGCPATTMGCTPAIDSLFEATWGCKLGNNCPAGADRNTWFDTSQVDGWTIPYKLYIAGNTQCDCTGSGCTNLTLIDGSRLNLANCPSNEDLSYFNQYPQYAHEDLRFMSGGVVVACKSGCKQFTAAPVQTGKGMADGSLPALYYCCPTPNPNNCQVSQGCIGPNDCRAGPVKNTKYVQAVHDGTDLVYAYSYDDLVGLHTCPAAGVTYTMEYCPPGSPPYPYNPSATSAPSSTSSSSGSTGGCPANFCGAGLSCCNTYANGPACYNPSQYSCTTNDQGRLVLCSAGYQSCGNACYSPSLYRCVNGQLQPR